MNITSYQEKDMAAQAARAEYSRKTEALSKIIRPLQTAKYEADVEWRYIQKALEEYAKDYGGMDLTPDFQRGHVWTPRQQQHYIENVLRGVISTSGFIIQLNCPNWEMGDDGYSGDLPRGMQCIDGLQRITAVTQFLAGEVKPFGLAVDDLNGSSFSMKMSRYRFRLAIHNFKTRAQLLQHYLDLNAGGTPHSSDEIERVSKMRDALLAK